MSIHAPFLHAASAAAQRGSVSGQAPARVGNWPDPMRSRSGRQLAGPDAQPVQRRQLAGPDAPFVPCFGQLTQAAATHRSQHHRPGGAGSGGAAPALL